MASANTSELGGFSAWVWSHFTLVQISDDVVKTECGICRRMLAYMGQTTSMLKHLRTVHCMIPPPSPSIPRRVAQATASQSSQLSTAFDAAVVHYDLNTIIARLAAEDNVPFKTIATSPTFKLLLESLVGRASPKSPNSVKAIVNTKANEARKSVRDSLEQYQRSGKSFSICFDEAVASNSQHSYISLSLRTEPAAGDDHAGPDTYLGLIQLAGKGNADTIAAAVTNRLQEYGVNIRNCFFAVTDGAAVMKSTVSKLGLKSQLCFAHALHIALQKVLDLSASVSISQRGETFSSDDVDEGDDENEAAVSSGDDVQDDTDMETETKPRSSLDDASGDDISQNSMDGESDDGDFQCFAAAVSEDEARENEVVVSVKTSLRRLRKTLKLIKRSAPKRHKLREVTRQNHGKSLQVLLDTKIRWSSTAAMLERALLILPSINTVLLDSNESAINAQERQNLEHILAAIKPFKTAIDMLSSAQANLVYADRIILALLQCLHDLNSGLSILLSNSVAVEVLKRRTGYSSVLQYLLDPRYDWSFEESLGIARLSQSEIRNLLNGIAHVDNVSGGIGEEALLPSATPSFAMNFQNVFSTPLRSPRTPYEAEPISGRILREMKRFEAGEQHGMILKSCCNRLLTVQPTSVKAEREFSIMNHVCSKARNSLSPRTLDNLVVLRALYRDTAML